jgi:hypothetical protein
VSIQLYKLRIKTGNISPFFPSGESVKYKFLFREGWIIMLSNENGVWFIDPLIKNTHVIMTIFNGRIAYRQK